MAANGIRFDRFYAGAPNCSPTRASVMTGRSNDRTGVYNHGFPLRLQEPTVARALRDAGYATGHFGKWHLNGLWGPGVPIVASDTHGPGGFGFDTWLSVTNFFDRDPIMGQATGFVEPEGDSSEIIVARALEFVSTQHQAHKPFFAVIWYGSPHAPFVASDADRAPFEDLDETSQHHYGELVAMDRSIGALRDGLRSLGIADETLVWFTSDNGGLPRITPDTTGGLRGFKNDVYEGGLRVPAINRMAVRNRRAVRHLLPGGDDGHLPDAGRGCGTAGLRPAAATGWHQPAPLFHGRLTRREKPIPFRPQNRGAFVDNNYKLVTLEVGSGKYELYDLEKDPNETTDLFNQQPETAGRLQAAFEAWSSQVEASIAGVDYPGGTVDPNQPERRPWWEDEAYNPYLEDWKKRPEYAERLKRALP